MYNNDTVAEMKLNLAIMICIILHSITVKLMEILTETIVDAES
jgi:hypothetical protein